MKLWENNIRKVVPYVPGEQPNRPNMIKLNTNENPYPPSPLVDKKLKEFNIDSLRLYPDPKITDLVHSIADYHGFSDEEVFVGVGSDDVLAMAFLTCFNSKKPILFPDITYSFYDVWADLFQIPYHRPKLDNDFRIKKEDYYVENGGIVIANPNAPTGVNEELGFIEDILIHNPGVVVIVDEAYVDFGGTSAMSLIPKYDNLLVVQTFSKSRSMAGMRIGYCVGNKDLIKAINDVKYSYNSYTLNTTTIELGVASIDDDSYFKAMIEKVIATREHTKERLRNLGFSFADSKSNFIFATHKEKSAKEIFEKLREMDIYVRYFNAPRVDNYLRISIGTDGEMDRLIECLSKIL